MQRENNSTDEVNSINEIPKKYEEKLKQIMLTCCEFADADGNPNENVNVDEIKDKLLNQYLELDRTINEETQLFLFTALKQHMLLINKSNQLEDPYPPKRIYTNKQIISKISDLLAN